MTRIPYWITFTAAEDKYREVLAVLLVFEMAEDRSHYRASVPAFGIEAEADTGVMGLALTALYDVLARSEWGGRIRQGLQTVALRKETRPMLIAGQDEPVIGCGRTVVFTPERYREEQIKRPSTANMYWLLEKIEDVSVLDKDEAGALALSDALAVDGLDAGTQTDGEFSRCDAVSDPAVALGVMRFNEDAFSGVFDIADLRPVLTAKEPTIEDIASVKIIGGRVINDDLAPHDLDVFGGLGLGHAAGDSVSTRLGGGLLINDVARHDAQGGTHLEGWLGRISTKQDFVSPAPEVFDRIDNDGLSTLFIHQRQIGVFCDQRGVADAVSPDLPEFEDGHLVEIGVDAAYNDRPLMPRRPATSVGGKQHFARTGGRFEQFELSLHDP